MSQEDRRRGDLGVYNFEIYTQSQPAMQSILRAALQPPVSLKAPFQISHFPQNFSSNSNTPLIPNTCYYLSLSLSGTTYSKLDQKNMGSSYFGEPNFGNERASGSSSSSSSSRKGKKNNSEKPKQPQRGLGVAQLEKLRLHGQMACAHHPSLHAPNCPSNFNNVILYSLFLYHFPID